MSYKSRQLEILDPEMRHPDINNLFEEFNKDWLSQHELSEGTQLFHYTTVDGLNGIFKDRALWCGHYSSFNDPLEIQYGKKIIHERFSKILGELQEDYDYLRQFVAALSTNIDAFGRSLHHIYISCFCESGNLLSQWREYSDGGGGYCIGFEFTSDTLIKPKGDTGDGYIPILRKVIYDEKTQIELVDDVLKKTIDATINFCNKMSAKDANYIAYLTGGDIANLLTDLIISFKKPVFDVEKEWRLIRVKLDSNKPENLRFRSHSGSLIPYLETCIYEDNDEKIFPVRSIQFGPFHDDKRTKTSLELFLKYIRTTNDLTEIRIPDEIDIIGTNFQLRP